MQKVVIDCSTGSVTKVELTAEEIAQREADAEAYAAAEAERIATEEAAAVAKASGIAKLLALGLNEDEANALVK